MALGHFVFTKYEVLTLSCKNTKEFVAVKETYNRKIEDTANELIYV